MKIAELTNSIADRDEVSLTATLGDFSINDDASLLTVRGDQEQAFWVDEGTEKALASFLRIPLPYLKSCPDEFRATTLRFWFNQRSEATAVVDAVNGSIVSVHSPSHVTVPMRDIVGVVSRVFSPDDDVRVLQDERRLHIDVISPQYSVEVPNPDRVPGRPEVGDVTVGGLRLLSFPGRAKAPSVSTYLERLICTNGMTTDHRLDEISLKGRTVDEVIEEMELVARRLLAAMPEGLDRYAATARMRVPGDPAAFAAQLARENNFSRPILDQVLDQINQLPYVTVYDVNQAFTQIANGDIGYSTATRLQRLGGELALNADHAVARCNSCERLL